MRDSNFDKAALPTPPAYFASIGNPLRGRGPWRNAICPFHDDTRPSLRVNVERGGWRCMACGARGGDVLALHMKRTGMDFKQALHDLGAWQ